VVGKVVRSGNKVVRSAAAGSGLMATGIECLPVSHGTDEDDNGVSIRDRREVLGQPDRGGVEREGCGGTQSHDQRSELWFRVRKGCKLTDLVRVDWEVVRNRVLCEAGRADWVSHSVLGGVVDFAEKGDQADLDNLEKLL